MEPVCRERLKKPSSQNQPNRKKRAGKPVSVGRECCGLSVLPRPALAGMRSCWAFYAGLGADLSTSGSACALVIKRL